MSLRNGNLKKEKDFQEIRNESFFETDNQISIHKSDEEKHIGPTLTDLENVEEDKISSHHQRGQTAMVGLAGGESSSSSSEQESYPTNKTIAKHEKASTDHISSPSTNRSYSFNKELDVKYDSSALTSEDDDIIHIDLLLDNKHGCRILNVGDTTTRTTHDNKQNKLYTQTAATDMENMHLLQRSDIKSQGSSGNEQKCQRFYNPSSSLVDDFLLSHQHLKASKSIPLLNKIKLEDLTVIKHGTSNTDLSKTSLLHCSSSSSNIDQSKDLVNKHDIIDVSSICADYENTSTESPLDLKLLFQKYGTPTSSSNLVSDGTKTLSMSSSPSDSSDKSIKEIDSLFHHSMCLCEQEISSKKISDASTSSDNSDDFYHCKVCNCSNEIKRLNKELQEYKEKLSWAELKMAHQSQYIQELRSADRFKREMHNYPPPDGYNYSRPNYSFPMSHNSTRFNSSTSSSSSSTTGSTYSPYPSSSSSSSVSSENSYYSNNSSNSSNYPCHNSEISQLMALRLENTSLAQAFEQEKLKRINAEVTAAKDRDYIRRLENSLQNLQSTKLVMDPVTYKNVADNYIESRIKSSRPTSTHHCCGNSHLVCDKLTTLKKEDNWSNYKSSRTPR